MSRYRTRAEQAWYGSQHYQRHKDSYGASARQQREKTKATIRAAKDVPCADCGMRYPYYVMQFDHRPGEIKLFEVSDLGRKGSYSWATIRREIAKCDAVCANCHAERTHQRWVAMEAAASDPAPPPDLTLF